MRGNAGHRLQRNENVAVDVIVQVVLKSMERPDADRTITSAGQHASARQELDRADLLRMGLELVQAGTRSLVQYTDVTIIPTSYDIDILIAGQDSNISSVVVVTSPGGSQLPTGHDSNIIRTLSQVVAENIAIDRRRVDLLVRNISANTIACDCISRSEHGCIFGEVVVIDELVRLVVVDGQSSGTSSNQRVGQEAQGVDMTVMSSEAREGLQRTLVKLPELHNVLTGSIDSINTSSHKQILILVALDRVEGVVVDVLLLLQSVLQREGNINIATTREVTRRSSNHIHSLTSIPGG